LLVPALLTSLPVLYYALLPSFDAGWAQSKAGTAYSFTPFVPAVLVTLAPIALIMAPGYTRPSRDAGDRMLKLWPLAAVILFVVSPNDAMHAFGGFAVPAAVLSVRGWPWVARHLPEPVRRHAAWVAAAAIAFSILAAPIAVVHRVVQYQSGDQSFAEIGRDEASALDWIASQPPGGVLSGGKAGAWAPAVTDHETWLGHPVWTPHYDARYRQVAALFSGSMDSNPARVRSFVASTGAKFVLEPCYGRARLRPALASAGFTERKFGCATVFSRPD
jgi:hypothetical protein